MSAEAPKTVEETPAAVPAVETPAETPAAEPAAETAAEPAAEAATETPAAEPAAETEAAAEAPKEEAKEEVTAATDGTLGYKGPGLVKSFRFAKRFFYFSDEAVEAKNLTAYLASEKSSAAAQRTAAWATQTGKGLLFYTKRAEDKATPAGIFNLSEVTDVNKEGSNEFSFKTGSQKHTFQASGTERDSWIAALTAKTEEATAEKETITESEGYKAELEKITKPAVAAAAVKAAPAPEKDTKETEAAAEDKKEDKKEEKKEEKKEDKKSRSQSRKRASIFGSILGKKEKDELKEETPAATEETPADAAPAEEAAAAEPAAATEAAETPAADAAPAETTEAAEAAPAEDKKEEPKSATKSKRASIFGNFFNKVASPNKEKSEEEVAPVASTAPQLENPVDESAAKPIEPETVTDAPAVEAAAAETPAEEKKEEKKEEASPETKEKRRTSIFGTLGKKVKAAESGSDSEGKKTGNKLGGLFRKPSKAVKSEEKKDKEAAPAEEAIPEGEDKAAAPAEETPAAETTTEAAAEKTEEAAAAAEPVNVAPAAAPVQAAA